MPHPISRAQAGRVRTETFGGDIGCATRSYAPNNADAAELRYARGVSARVPKGLQAPGRAGRTHSVSWFEDADPPDLNLLGQETASVAAILGVELDLRVTSG